MLILSILILLFSNAVSLRRDMPVLFIRIALVALAYCFLLILQRIDFFYLSLDLIVLILLAISSLTLLFMEYHERYHCRYNETFRQMIHWSNAKFSRIWSFDILGMNNEYDKWIHSNSVFVLMFIYYTSIIGLFYFTPMNTYNIVLLSALVIIYFYSYIYMDSNKMIYYITASFIFVSKRWYIIIILTLSLELLTSLPLDRSLYISIYIVGLITKINIIYYCLKFKWTKANFMNLIKILPLTLITVAFFNLLFINIIGYLIYYLGGFLIIYFVGIKKGDIRYIINPKTNVMMRVEVSKFMDPFLLKLKMDLDEAERAQIEGKDIPAKLQAEIAAKKELWEKLQQENAAAAKLEISKQKLRISSLTESDMEREAKAKLEISKQKLRISSLTESDMEREAKAKLEISKQKLHISSLKHDTDISVPQIKKELWEKLQQENAAAAAKLEESKQKLRISYLTESDKEKKAKAKLEKSKQKRPISSLSETYMEKGESSKKPKVVEQDKSTKEYIDLSELAAKATDQTRPAQFVLTNSEAGKVVEFLWKKKLEELAVNAPDRRDTPPVTLSNISVNFRQVFPSPLDKYFLYLRENDPDFLKKELGQAKSKKVPSIRITESVIENLKSRKE